MDNTDERHVMPSLEGGSGPRVDQVEKGTGNRSEASKRLANLEILVSEAAIPDDVRVEIIEALVTGFRIVVRPLPTADT